MSNQSISAVSSSTTALLSCKCVRCRRGKMFKHSAFNVKQFMEMNDLCPNCGLRFEVEPGFFWGAMYISYAFTTGILIVSGVLVYFLLNDPEFWVYLVTVISITFISIPWNFRYSRALMLYLFSSVSFDNKLSK